MNSMPPVPSGQENFFYASQSSFWIYYRVNRALLEARLGNELTQLGLSLPRFRNDDHAYVALTPMFYTAQFGQQNTKANQPGLAGISELEFNVMACPRSREKQVPQLSFQEFLLGWEQQKLIGQHRIAVVCNHLGAVYGGRDKYGEHKFLGDIDYKVSTINNNTAVPAPFSIEFSAYQWKGAGQEDQLLFRLTASVDDLVEVPSDFSPIVVYGALPPEPRPGARQRLIGSRRSHLGIFKTYFPTHAPPREQGHAILKYGRCENAPLLTTSSGVPIPESADWPKSMRETMEHLLSRAELAAFQLFQSPPAETEPRPYYVDLE